MIEEITNDVLGKLLLTTPKDSEELVGIEDHIAEMSLLLQHESEEVRMVGIWGSSGIGKTTIARALFRRLSRHFQGSTFIDRDFVSKSRNNYSGANPDDPNMKLQLQGHFLSKILGEKDIKIDDPTTLEERLKHQKVLIIIDDLDDIMVLDTLVGQTQWFGSGSRIIVVTNDKHFLTAHGIDHIYEVSFPTDVHACQMLCQSAFKQNYAPEGFEHLVVDVVRHACNFPLGLNLLGKYLRGRNEEYWMDILPRLENGLRIDGKIERILRISYDGLDSEDQAIFRHIACLFNHMEVTTIKSLLADSIFGVNVGLQNLIDKSIIYVRWGHVEMHRLLQEMGRKIVRIQSIGHPGEREFLVDPNDIRYVLNACTIEMRESKLYKLWEGVVPLTCLKKMDLHGSSNLKAIPDLSMATNLEILNLELCQSLVKLPSSIRNLNKLLNLDMLGCESLAILPTGFNLKSLDRLNFKQCSKLKTFPKFSTNISVLNLFGTNIEEYPSHLHLENLVEFSISKEEESNMKQWERAKPLTPFLAMMLSPTLTRLYLENIPSLVELPSSFQNLIQLKNLTIIDCMNLETLPTGINLQSLDSLSFKGCSRLRSFPEISTNISRLCLDRTWIEEVPWWIEKFSNLTNLGLRGCRRLKCVSLHISKLKHLEDALFPACGALTRVELSGYSSGMKADNIDTASSSLPQVELDFRDCFNLDPETVLHQESIIFKYMLFPGKEEVPSYFTYRTTGVSSLTIPLLHVPLSQPFFRFRVGALVTNSRDKFVELEVKCEFKDRFGNNFDYDIYFKVYNHYYPLEDDYILAILDCRIPLNEENAPLAQRNYYDHVEINVHISSRSWRSFEIKEWGIRLLEDSSSVKNRLGNPNSTLPHVSEAEEGNMGYNTPVQGLVNEIEHSGESGDNNVETERSTKRIRIDMATLYYTLRSCPAAITYNNRFPRQKHSRTGSFDLFNVNDEDYGKIFGCLRFDAKQISKSYWSSTKKP
ncbi:AAA+ ATPase domain [Arabidopsis thaliana x Arabidopsis arenosa]|nr:AAA+ ATPase domain [Arabidopsis thaliana x Arabidopsis arenosa]